MSHDKGAAARRHSFRLRHLTCGPPQKSSGTVRPEQAVTTPVEQSACCLETELASVLVSSVTFCQTVSGPPCLSRPLEHHAPVLKKGLDRSLLDRSRGLEACQNTGRALLPHLAAESVWSTVAWSIYAATAVIGATARKSTAVPSRVKRPRVRTTVAAASLAQARGCFSTSSRLGAPLRADRVVAMSASASLTPSAHAMIHMAAESERGVNV